MDSRLVMFSIFVLAAVFSMVLPMDSVYAQTFDIYTDGEDGDHDGKSCPFKENKGASFNPSLII